MSDIINKREDNMQEWFELIKNELRLVAAQIHHKDGWLFFKNYTMTKEQLLEHPSFLKAESIMDNLAHLVEEWRKSASIDKARVEYYQRERISIIREMGILREEILLRKRTEWESFKSAFESLLNFVADRLPRLSDTILKLIGHEPSEKQRVLSDDRARVAAMFKRKFES